MGAGVSKRIRISARPSSQPPQLPSLDTDSPILPRSENNSVKVLQGINYDEDDDLQRAMLESTRMSQDCMSSPPDQFFNDSSELMDLQEFSDVPPTMVSTNVNVFPPSKFISIFHNSRFNANPPFCLGPSPPTHHPAPCLPLTANVRSFRRAPPHRSGSPSSTSPSPSPPSPR
jgi:hypothetical protein